MLKVNGKQPGSLLKKWLFLAAKLEIFYLIFALQTFKKHFLLLLYWKQSAIIFTLLAGVKMQHGIAKIWLKSAKQ